jgi:hypothetical protein
MPLYDFQNVATGERREFLVDAGVRFVRRGGAQWRRCLSVPYVPRGHRQPGQAEEVLAGYKAKEEREGSRFQSRHSVKAIKKAWST